MNGNTLDCLVIIMKAIPSSMIILNASSGIRINESFNGKVLQIWIFDFTLKELKGTGF